MGLATTTADVTKVGTLVVDIFDSQTKQLLCRGKESADLTGSPAKNATALSKDVTSMFKHFPPSH